MNTSKFINTQRGERVQFIGQSKSYLPTNDNVGIGVFKPIKYREGESMFIHIITWGSGRFSGVYRKIKR